MNRYKNTPPIKRDPPCACGSGKPAYLRYVDGKPTHADCCDTCWETHSQQPQEKEHCIMIRYFKLWPDGDTTEEQLRNGSFLRTGTAGRGKAARYMNGDFIDLLDETPASLTFKGHEEIPVETARRYLPRCCGGKGR